MYAESKLFTLLAVLATGASVVSAHGHVMSWTINGEVKNGDNPSNSGMYGATAQRPSDNSDQGFVPDITAGRVACGGTSAGSGLETWPVDAGSTISANWDTWPASHKGPIIEYMAACPASGCDGVDAASLSWFKISEKSFDGIWAGETLSQTKTWDFTIPADIASGPYLVRHEVIAMHSKGSPQVYPYCFQADVQGGGSANPAGVNIIDAYNTNPDFKTFDVYSGDQSLFTAPGPAVYGGGGSGGGSPAPAPTSSAAPAPSSAPAASSEAVPTETYEEPPEEPAATAPSSPDVTSSTAAASSAAPAASSQSSAPAPSSAPSTPASGGNGGVRNDQSCMNEMNQCKDAANRLPNAQVAAAFTACDAQLAQCTRKRSVIARYSRRGFPMAF